MPKDLTMSLNICIFCLWEAKLDDTFPTAQFNNDGFCGPYRHGYCSVGRDIFLGILYKRDIPSRLLADYRDQDGFEYFFVKINIRKKKINFIYPKGQDNNR